MIFKKAWKVLPLILVTSLSSCSTHFESNDGNPLLLFHTQVYFRLGAQRNTNGLLSVKGIIDELKTVDELADIREREATNVYTLNHTNERVEISKNLYELLRNAKELMEKIPYFNPLIGSLSDKWKESLNLAGEEGRTPTLLSNAVIQEELEKINSTDLILEAEKGSTNTYYATRQGEALIDLGAIAKGYALDRALGYELGHTGLTDDYIIDAGRSSILLGKNSQRNSGKYIVQINENSPKVVIEENNCFISTSGISEQQATIDGKKYSHIINPVTGSAESIFDQIVVITKKVTGAGAFGDAISTSFMMSSLDEIKEAEEEYDIKVIAIKNGSIVYKSEGIALAN